MLDQTFPTEVIPFREFPDGIFLMRKQSTKLPGARHYGVLIAGAPLSSFGVSNYEPLVIHRTAEMRAERAETTGAWEVVEQVPPDQTQSALARASEEFEQPNYYLLTNNCEHTARYITSGEKLSTQVGNFLGIGLLAVAAICLVTQSED